MMHRLDLPPLSVNKAFQGKRYRTPEYKSWGDSAQWLLRPLASPGSPINYKVCLRVLWHLKNASMADTDNPLKSFADALVRSGILKDDHLIWRIEAEKIKDTEDFIEFEIIPYVASWEENESVVKVSGEIPYVPSGEF